MKGGDKHSCNAKEAYPSHRLARRAVRVITNWDDWSGKDRGPLHPYLCVHCGRWHVGKADPRRDKRKRPKPEPTVDDT